MGTRAGNRKDDEGRLRLRKKRPWLRLSFAKGRREKIAWMQADIDTVFL